MIERPTPEEIKQIAALFQRDDTVENFVGEKPRRLVYASYDEPAINEGKVTPGTHITESTNIHWDDPATEVEFHGVDGAWAFSASRLIKGYFSLSRNLSASEIDRLKPNLILAFGCSSIRNATDKDINSNIYGKMTFVRASNANSYEAQGGAYQGRKLVGFSLNEPGVNLTEMSRIWIDFIIAEPKSKTIIIQDPILLLQERLFI